MRNIVIAAVLALAVGGSALAQDAPPYKIGDGVTAPVPVWEVKPVYPPDAKDERVTGIVELAGVVETDGSIDKIEVTTSLDERLDQAAVKALSQWKFRPGRKDGKPVPVKVNVEMTFTVR